MDTYLLAIDQGTTSTRAMVFDHKSRVLGVAQQEFKQHFPQSGWVEHDPEDILKTTLDSCQGAILAAGLKPEQIAAIGITNQRETTLVWDRSTGKTIYPAIVWQDRRTADYCQQLKEQGWEQTLSAKTGLLLDPYFSATKLRWILDHVDGAQDRAKQGELAFGTVDSYLLWHLTGGKVHRTDATNASRTLLFNIHNQQWDADLLELFQIPESLLPEVMDSAANFGTTAAEVLGAEIPILGIAGDQQAALIGQCCFKPGAVKSTYGTGCFLMLNTGQQALSSSCRLLTTVAYRLNGQTCYALEGSIFMAGATIQWLRDGLKLISDSAQSQSLAEAVAVDHGVYMVPAFTGMGAPYWDAEARGAILGMTRDTGIGELVSAALQSVGYQTADLLKAMADEGCEITELRVDGGMVVNDWLVQFLADILNVPVERPGVIETTALGAAYLAGLQLGVFKSLDELNHHWRCQQRFVPKMNAQFRQKLYLGWKQTLASVLNKP